MNNLSILSKTLETSNNLILSEEFKVAYSKKNSFVRNRKLSFSNSIYFMLSNLRKSLSAELAMFTNNYKQLNFPAISKQAFSKARQNISHEAFKELCRIFVNHFYDKNSNLEKWNDYNVYAIDGTSIQVPDTPENIEYFGYKSNQYTTKTALASASALYDVLNDIIIDASINSYPQKERVQAIKHIESITNPKLLDKTIITFDRGYPSFEFFDFLEKRNIFFVFRVSKSFKFTQNNPEDIILPYKKGSISGNVRVIKVPLPDGTIETLITNIFNSSITSTKFKELYFLRWGIECKYKELKCSIQIEEFSGKKPIAIKQDFYASIYLSSISSLLKKETDVEIKKEQQEKDIKYEYQANRNFILCQVFEYIIKLLIHKRKRKKLLLSIIENTKRIRSHKRPNRSYERKKKHPRKKHHHNIKACI
jgi:hypothetical protein